ncbi:MAG: TonB-dependent receptor [Rhodothermales bacterium]
MVSRFLWSVVVLVVVLVHDARGQQVDSVRTVVLDEVTVEAERQSGPAFRPPPGSMDAARDLAGVLSGMGGVDLRQYGATGSAHLSLRGLSAGHTTVLLEGIPLTHPQTGQVDLSLIPVAGLRSIALRGGLGDGHGGLGGGLHLDVGPRDAGVTTHAVAGEWGERQYGVEVSGEGLGGRGMLAWQGGSTPGAFPYQDPYALDNVARTRHGAGRSSQSLMAHHAYDGRVRTNLLAWWSASQRGLAGPVNSPPGEAWQSTTLGRAQGSIETGRLSGKLRIRVDGAWTGHDLAWRDPSSDGPSGTAGSDLRASTRFLQTHVRWMRESARVRWVVTPSLRVDHDRARVDATRTTDHAEWRTESGLALARTTERSRLEAFVGMRSAPGVPLGMRGGLNVSRDLRGQVRIRAAGGHHVRHPTFTDRYWLPGGNPDLRPELGWTTELGLDVRGVSVTAFRTDLRDRIVWRPKLAGAGTSVVRVYTPENVGLVVSRGLEFRLSGASDGRLDLSWTLHGTMVSAVDRSRPGAPAYNHQLRYTPSRMAGGAVRAALHGWHVDIVARHTGRRYMTADASRWLEPQTSFDVRLGHSVRLPGARLDAWLRVNNALDAYLEGMRLYPLPPRHVQGGIRLSTVP